MHVRHTLCCGNQFSNSFHILLTNYDVLHHLPLTPLHLRMASQAAGKTDDEIPTTFSEKIAYYNNIVKALGIPQSTVTETAIKNRLDEANTHRAIVEFIRIALENEWVPQWVYSPHYYF